jgi:hypothetical protein
MARRGAGKSRRSLSVGAFILLGLAAVAIGLSLAPDAAAIDLTDPLHKAAKGAAAKKGTALPKGVLPKGLALPKGVALPKGLALPNGAALPKNTALPNSAVLPKGTALSTGTDLTKGTPLGKGTPLAKGTDLGKGTPLAKGADLGKGAPLGKGTDLGKGAALPKSIRPGANATQPAALSNRSTTNPLAGQRRDLSKLSTQDYRRVQVDHRRSILLARSLLPIRPLPGQRGFTGVPQVGETRFVSNEMVFQVGPNVSQQTIDNVARRLGLSAVASESFALTGGTLIHFRVAGGRPVADVVRDLEAERIGVASPNYVYTLQQDATLAAKTQAGDPSQYVVEKLRLAEVHRVATGSNVLVAVIDSEIDLEHPDLAGAIVERFDAVGRPNKPDAHGTGMAGAIAARQKLMGIAPGARILAIHAFSTEAKESPQATTRHILAGLEWAIKKGARVINMSFAGPYDPMLQLAMKNAREKGVVLIAAAGNAGPKSPPLYPAADPNVIAVTATDEDDQLFEGANQGPHVAVAAPGVNILEPAPNDTYQVTTGTSVAAAHVSGVAALLMERNPALDPVAVHEILTMSAKNVGSTGRDDKFGWGLVDPSQALLDLDAKVAQDRASPPAKTVAANPIAPNPAAPKPAAPKPAAAKPAALNPAAPNPFSIFSR